MRDTDVRRVVKDSLTAEHGGDPNTRLIEEMCVWSGTVRIDIAVVNGALTGYELKSDSDTLDRLPNQARLYNRVFDALHLVVGQCHADKAVKIIPEWWGVTLATSQRGEIVLRELHPAGLNPSQDPYLIAELLSKVEAVSVLESYGLANGWRSKRVRLIHERLAYELPLAELKAQVRAILKQRPRRATACLYAHA